MEALEDEVWRLKGGKGPRPKDGMEVVQLWEAGEGKKSWWRRVIPWDSVKNEAGEVEAPVDNSDAKTVAARTTA